MLAPCAQLTPELLLKYFYFCMFVYDLVRIQYISICIPICPQDLFSVDILNFKLVLWWQKGSNLSFTSQHIELFVVGIDVMLKIYLKGDEHNVC